MEIKLSGRVTHQLTAELIDPKWREADREEELQEQVHALAQGHDWTLEGRTLGPIFEISETRVIKPETAIATADGIKLWGVRQL